MQKRYTSSPSRIRLAYSFAITKGWLTTLSEEHGAGQHAWHLMVDGYFFGTLRYCNGWMFDSIKMPEMADFLGDYITAWSQ